MENFLPIYCVYDHPRDYPNHWVVRIQHPLPAKVVPSLHCYLFSTLDEARAWIPPGLVHMVRNPDDDPVLTEIWL